MAFLPKKDEVAPEGTHGAGGLEGWRGDDEDDWLGIGRLGCGNNGARASASLDNELGKWVLKESFFRLLLVTGEPPVPLLKPRRQKPALHPLC